MSVAIVDSAAGARMPHGSPIRFEGKRCLREPDLARAEGVTKRPSRTGATHHEKGEPLKVQTSGGIMAVVDGHARWLELQTGRIVNVGSN